MLDFIRKRPSAYLPMLMSLGAFLFTVSYVAFVGIPAVEDMHDEGAAARIFQLLMALQLPIILFFLLKWLPKNLKDTFIVFGLQIVLWILAFAPVYFLEL